MRIREIFAILFCLSVLIFAESYQMRIGDSQYFKADKESGKVTKVTLVGVQNGVAILKKENIENTVNGIDYFYLAPQAPTAVPISLQPYPNVVYDSNVKIRGIGEPGQGILVWKAGADKLFENSQKVLNANVVYDGASFSVEIPLEKGDNTYFFSYEGDVVGNRAEADIRRVDPPTDMLSVDLDPIGSSDARKTNMIVSNAKPGTLVGFETIMGRRTVETDQNVENEGNFLFSASNTLVEASERMFDISLFDYRSNLAASTSIVVPVSETVPECSMTYDSSNLTPTRSVTGSFKDGDGVRFAWIRILDYRRNEYKRSFVDLERVDEGNFSIHYDDLKELTFKVFDKGFGLLHENVLSLPETQIKNGEEFYLEIGVTDVAGNRSNTFLLNLFDSEFEKMIDISLDDAVPSKNVYEYPVLVRLNKENFVFTKTLESGDDVVFFDVDGKKLEMEKERFLRDDRVAEYWVKVPVVKANSNRIRLKVRWGNPLAEAYDGALVWKESFKGVYHFNEKFRGPYVIPNKDYYTNVVYTTGNLVIGERTVLNGAYQSKGSETLEVEPLPMPGTQDVVVRAGGKIALAPGSYGNLTVESNSVLNLSAGTYHFKNVTVDYDSKLAVDVDAGLVAMKASGNLVLRDRVNLRFVGTTDPSAVRLDVMGSSINVGYDAKINGILTAPNANVNISDRVEWNGALYVNNLRLGMDAVLNVYIPHKVYSYSPNAVKLFPPRSIKEYSLYAKKNILVNTQSRVSGNMGSESGVVIAEGSRVEGNVLAWNDIKLRSQSSLSGSAVVGGVVSADYNVNWSGNAIPLSKKDPMDIGSVYTQIGTRIAAVSQGQVSTIEPGLYESLIVGENAKVLLQNGIYYFGRVSISNGASLGFAEGAESAELIVSNQLTIENRARINMADKRLLVKYAGVSKVRIGTDCVVNGTFILPNSDFTLGDRSSMKGSLWAQDVVLGHQVTFVKGENEIAEDVDLEEAPYSSDWIVDATRYKNNGSARMAFAEPSYIANAEYWGLNGSAILKNGMYFKDGVGTMSAWLYFDGAEGNCFASSDDVTPRWSIKRSLEGNLVFKSGSATSYFPVPEQSWAFLTLVFEKTKVSVYVNGEYVKEISVSPMNGSMTPWFGVVGNGLFKIDELRYSDVALDADWIRLDYVTQKLNKNEEGAGEYAFVF